MVCFAPVFLCVFFQVFDGYPVFMDFFLYEVSFVVDAVGEYVQPGFNVRVHYFLLLSKEPAFSEAFCTKVLYLFCFFVFDASFLKEPVFYS